MAVGADGVDWAALKAMTDAGLTSADIRALAQKVEAAKPAGNKKAVPTPVGIRIPETPLPAGTTRIGGSLVTGGGPTFKTQPINEDGSPITAITKTDADKAAANNKSFAASAAVLREWGLEELIPELDTYIRGGRSWEEFELGFYDKATKQGQVVERIFPEWGQRRAAGNPLSIGAIVTYRAQAKQLLRSAGLPEGFYDEPGDFSSFIVRDVSLVELNDRVQRGYLAAANAPQETKDALRQFYGVSEAGIAAYFLDPSRALPAIEKQIAAASTGGGAVRAGYGALTSTEAERLAGLGVTGAAAVDAFGSLVQAGQLFDSLPGFDEDGISREEQIGFITGDAKAGAKVRRKAETRAAETVGGGGFASDRTGFSGFGTAR